jgi:hypothetical protein
MQYLEDALRIGEIAQAHGPQIAQRHCAAGARSRALRRPATAALAAVPAVISLQPD